MAGRRQSRHGGKPLARVARLARSQEHYQQRRQAAVDELERLGLAYSRVRAAAKKADKADKLDAAALRRLSDLTAALERGADAIQPRR